LKPTKPNKTGNATQQDRVMTNPKTAKSIIEYFKPEGKILEPCKGEGAFYDQLNGDKDWCEIDLGRDFFKYDKKVDCIYDQFLEKAMSISNNIVFFVPFSKLFKSKSNDLMVKNYGDIKELINMGTGSQHGFKMGFIVGCIYFKKNYVGDIKYTRMY
jgi:hypothetical protein